MTSVSVSFVLRKVLLIKNIQYRCEQLIITKIIYVTIDLSINSFYRALQFLAARDSVNNSIKENRDAVPLER